MGEPDLERYESEHRHPVNRALHFVGIPVVVLSFPLALWSWKLALVAHAAGWATLWIGHAVEGNLPASWRTPSIVLTALRWWIARIARRGRRAGGRCP
jgi:hypothetical protein